MFGLTVALTRTSSIVIEVGSILLGVAVARVSNSLHVMLVLSPSPLEAIAHTTATKAKRTTHVIN